MSSSKETSQLDRLGTVVHPKATIFDGPIVIGSECIIEEGAIIVNRRREVMRIGDDNLFEIGCRVECPSIGNFNTISQRARVHRTVKLSSYCVIGPACLVVPTEDQVVDDYTIIYGLSTERRVWSGSGKLQEADLRRKHSPDNNLDNSEPNNSGLGSYRARNRGIDRDLAGSSTISSHAFLQDFRRHRFNLALPRLSSTLMKSALLHSPKN